MEVGFFMHCIQDFWLLHALAVSIMLRDEQHVLVILLCCAANVATLAASLKVSSKDFKAAVQRVPPSLTRGMQIASETG